MEKENKEKYEVEKSPKKELVVQEDNNIIEVKDEIEKEPESGSGAKPLPKRTNVKLIAIVFALIMAFAVGVCGMYLVFKYVPLKGLNNITKIQKEVTVNDNGIADAVDKVYDSVVTVETYSSKKKISSGTGFVYKVENGKAYILTNNHVIEKGDEYNLTFTNGKQISAKLVGKDELSDIAVLQVDEKDIISVAEIGKSSDSRIGDTVFAVGAPLSKEYSWTVTRGILSGKDRMVEVGLNSGGTYIMKVIQTDAAINSGNSGGPLANANGQIIGITSMKLVSNGVEGIGFAIPIEDAIEYANKIEKDEPLAKPFLGVSMIELNDIYNLEQAGITLNPDIKSGVVVYEVEKNSPADKAGLKKGDVVTEINGEQVTSAAKLRYYLYKNQPGDTVKITVNRDGETKDIDVKLVEAN